jgi:hypothetical protein
VNLIENCLEVYRQPHGENYQQKTTLRATDNVTLTQLSDITIAISVIV